MNMQIVKNIKIPTLSEGVSNNGMPEDYHFNPENYLIGILSRAGTHKQDISVSLPSGGSLAIFPSRCEYFGHVENMEAFCVADAKAFKVKTLTSLDGNVFINGNVLGRNFDELLWQASYYASQGRLIKDCMREDVVEVSIWPNLTRLPCSSSAVAITALLARYPTSITLASRILNVPLEDMFRFYSAAFSAGFATVKNREVKTTDLKPHRDSTMLGQLLSRVLSL